MSKKPIVFISCGQYTPEEKKLGKEISDLIYELTPFQPYYAENQQSLEGLVENIFKKLYEASGFIAIMHHRGNVEYNNPFPQTSQKSTLSKIRASVWVEQEIAIAAFLRAVYKKTIEVKAFIQDGISLEGVREKLLLNPILFKENYEVIDHLKASMPIWTLESPEKLKLTINYEKIRFSQERHDYRLAIKLKNMTKKILQHYQLTLKFPKLLVGPNVHAFFVPNKSDAEYSYFQIDSDQRKEIIYPEQEIQLMTLDYFIDGNIFNHCPEVLKKSVVAKLFSEELGDWVEEEKTVSQIQNF